MLETLVEPNLELNTLTAEEITSTYTLVDYLKFAKSCTLFDIRSGRQTNSIYLKDKYKEMQVLIQNKLDTMTCTFLGNIEGTKIAIVLDKQFFYDTKKFFLENNNDNTREVSSST
jgi:hypothetical protein